MQRTSVALLALAALLTPVAACGGDDGGGGSVEAYCDLSAGLDGQEEFPSDDQLDELAAAAPDDIRDDVGFVVDRFKKENDSPEDAGAVFEDPEVLERIETIEAFEEENCDQPVEGE